MKVRKIQATTERTILIALITHTRILGQVFREMGRPGKPPPFKNRWANTVAGWCFDFYQKQNKAPGKLIQDYFMDHVAQSPEDDAIKVMESFLETLSSEYEKIEEQMNEKWVLDRAGDYFERIRLEKMTEQMQLALEESDTKRAREIYRSHQPVSFSSQAWLNPFSAESIRLTLERMEKVRPLIQFRGDLGRFLSEFFERDAFISFAAPEKKGKSFWLQEIVWTALNQRRRVLYYVLGDMSEEQVKRRLYSRMTMKPRKKPKNPVKWPLSIKITGKDADGKPIADVSVREINPEPYSEAEVEKAIEVLKMNSAMKRLPIRIMCKGAGEVSASDIEKDIEQLATGDGFVPDVVVIDYLDLLAPEPGVGKMEFRHQVDATWKICRRMSQTYHILVVGATQAAARSYDRWLIQKKDFSEDKRKNAHVTGMIGINQSPAEKQKGLYRLNWIFLRDGEWTENQFVWTAGNLALACPCMVSLL